MTFHPLRSFAVLIIAAAFAGGACTTGPGASAVPPATPAPSVAAANGECPTSQPAPLPAGETRTVTIATALGSMTLKIEADLSPIAAANFVALAGCGYYDGVVFHRVVPGFVIQGGDPTGTGTGGPGYTIKDEPVKAQYGRGVVAMARTDEPDSVGSQFFIVLDDAAREALESYNTYQIIGHVTAGMETADAITVAAAGVQLPTDPIAMTKVTVSNP
ncbi:MAG TPA: peptidylprolyl isomerase [Candidatus Limnocylindrales bacterium]|jgi:cyclophilin family peptidyl-prolyl cis-trans isomerase|nr:peptidylprolyl isomerase [Candidatus Limnocylindrales bacterium]